MAEPLLLTYNLNGLTAAGVRGVCEELGIRVREVRREEYALPIGALAGIPMATSGAPSGQAFDDEMLVMCHMLSDQLDAVLQGMRTRGVPRIALKAVLTPTNVTWSSAQLRDELAREHAAMARQARKP